MEYAIEIRNLTKCYGNIKAVDDLSIGVPKGKIYGFLGRNGAGKTTTLRMITGLVKPDSGTITVLGKDVTDEKRWAALNIGSIVETPGFYENLSAWENLDITARMFRVDKKRIGEVLKIVGLENIDGRKVKEFSLGMKQRLGIANALIHSPKVLLLDEPANGLDPKGIKDMRKFLRGLSEEHGITVMVSSHILSEVQQVADCVGIIDSGRLVEEVDVRDLYQEEQDHLLLEVDNIEAAELVLRNMNLKYSLKRHWIKVYCKRKMNCLINKNLVDKGIKVHNLSSVQRNLEERFLSIVDEKSA